MDREWLDRLERRFGALSVPGLASFLTAMNGAVWALSLFRPEFPYSLTLEPALALGGQPWRLLTFLFVPPFLPPLFLIFWLYLFYLYAQALEDEWGDFRFTVYYGAGVLATVLASFAVGAGLGNAALNATLFLAFARLYPDFEILVLFVLPVKVRWLAWLSWAGIGWAFLAGGSRGRAAVAAGVVNYLLFFGPELWDQARRLLRRLSR